MERGLQGKRQGYRCPLPSKKEKEKGGRIFIYQFLADMS
jgi:hypothetical protein